MRQDGNKGAGDSIATENMDRSCQDRSHRIADEWQYPIAKLLFCACPRTLRIIQLSIVPENWPRSGKFFHRGTAWADPFN